MSRMKRIVFALAAVFLLSVAAHTQIQNQTDDGQWIMPAKNYASTRFSTQTQINSQNVGSLKLAWTFSTGLTRGHEAAPLVVNYPVASTATRAARAGTTVRSRH